MRVLALLSSLVLASARRVAEEATFEEATIEAAAAADSESTTGPYEMQPLPAAGTFIGQDSPMLFPQLTPKPGHRLVINIHEESRLNRVNNYLWKIVVGGDKPITLGKCYSFSSGNSLQFKTTKNGPALFKIKQWKRRTNKPVFHIVSPKNNNKVYYTIRKRYHRLPIGRQELYVYLGKCTNNCQHKTRVYVAEGSKSNSWTFYKPGSDGVRGQPVAEMRRKDLERGIVGNDETFETEILDPTTDVGLVLAAISMADVHQNSRERGQYGVGLGVAAMVVR